MTSTKALRYALEKISEIPFEIIAPQHGSIIKDKETIRYIVELLSLLNGVGIDGIVEATPEVDYGNMREGSGIK
jgi:hypothetical protein